VGTADSDDEALLGAAWSDLDRLVGRLQRLSESAWRPRRELVMTLLDELARVDARLENVELTPLPDLANFALADALAVIGGDVLECLGAGGHRAVLDEVASLVQAALVSTR
jgi:hypothetical protein